MTDITPSSFPSQTPLFVDLSMEESPSLVDIPQMEMTPISPISQEITPSPRELVQSLQCKSKDKDFKDCPCLEFSRIIFAKFISYIERKGVFDTIDRQGRITKAINEVQKTDIGKKELAAKVLEWRKLLTEQENIYNTNIYYLENIMVQRPKFKETVSGCIRQVCDVEAWAAAMNEVSYVTNQALLLFSNAIVGAILDVTKIRTISNTKCKMHATKDECDASKDVDGGCTWKTPIFSKNTCEWKQPTSSIDLNGLIERVKKILTITPSDIVADANDARGIYALTLAQTFQQNIIQEDQSMCSMDNCNTFAKRLADEIWQIKIAKNPKFIYVPDEQFADYSSQTVDQKQRFAQRYNQATTSTQKILKELKNARQQLDLLSLPQASCNANLAASYIIWMWAVSAQL